jgi:predicted DNA-binding transcriptional regulator YafY
MFIHFYALSMGCAMANPFANSLKFLSAVNLLASPRGTTIRGLMEELNVSRRTAFRLLEALEELGFPLIDDQLRPRAEKTYRLLDSYVLKLPNITIPNPALTGEEIEAVLSILDFCNKLVKINPMLTGIREKITAMKPKENKEHDRRDDTKQYHR